MGTGILVGLAFMFLVVAIAAIILRIACGIVGVENTPDLGRAMIIVLGNVLAMIVISFLLGMVGLGGHAQNSIVGALVSAKVYESMLPTSFGKGLLIWLAQFVICCIIGFGLAMLMGGMLAGLMMRH